MVNPTGGNARLVNPDWKDTAIFSVSVQRFSQ